MSEQTAERGHRKTRQGLVVSDKMDKTVTVQIDKLVMHPVYKKYVRQRVKYKVHDERNEARTGDTVLIEECRPMSRHKRWRMKAITHRPA
ncbi:MAG: 30S ribosomal protein S17 [Myxococcales bacterium]|nr:30S ribosomal protein S17 [Myxococcales bacterium]